MRWAIWVLIAGGFGCVPGATEACLSDYSVDEGYSLGDSARVGAVEAECTAEGLPCTVAVTPEAAECVARENGLPEGEATVWLVFHVGFESAVWNVQVVTNERSDGFDGMVGSVDAVTGTFLELSKVSASASASASR